MKYFKRIIEIIIFLIILLVTIVLASCTKTIKYPDKYIDVHFKLIKSDIEINNIVYIGINDSIKTINLFGNLDYIIKLKEGWQYKFTFISINKKYTTENMYIEFNNKFNYHICTAKDTAIHGIDNKLIYIPVN